MISVWVGYTPSSSLPGTPGHEGSLCLTHHQLIAKSQKVEELMIFTMKILIVATILVFASCGESGKTDSVTQNPVGDIDPLADIAPLSDPCDPNNPAFYQWIPSEKRWAYFPCEGCEEGPSIVTLWGGNTGQEAYFLAEINKVKEKLQTDTISLYQHARHTGDCKDQSEQPGGQAE